MTPEPEEAAPQTTFDDLLDRALRGEAIDVARVLAEHPELSEDERRQIEGLCGSSAGTSAGPIPPRAGARLPFSRIGDLRLVERIGAGAMGAVFLADDPALGRQVAVKVLGPDILGTGERGDRFVREVRAAARLRHPNIVTVHSAGEENGLRYMVMELVPGRSLQEAMAEGAARGTRIPVADVLRIGADVARALHAAHEAGIVHRDVKPSNIRIHEDGRAILLDFGLARDVGDATLTETGAFRGSPQYASPEQVDPGIRELGPKTDVYSLGATLYEMLTGVAPFRGESRAQLFHAILTRDPVPPRRLDPAIPRDLETVLLAALEKDPGRRHASAGALADDLDAVRDGRPISVRPPSAAGRAARWVRRHPARAVLALVLAVAVPTIGGLLGFVAANLSKIDEAESAARARALADHLETSFTELTEGDPIGAERLFEEAVRSDPGSPDALAGLTLARILARKLEAAIAVLDGLPPALAQSAWACELRVNALRQLGRPDDAKPLEASLPRRTTAADHFVAGLIDLDRVHEGRLPAATTAFSHLRAAVWLSPTHLYMSELGHAAQHAGRDAEARQIAAAIEAHRPESPERWFAVGRTLLYADRPAALLALEKAARSPPRSSGARAFIAVGLATIEPTPARLALAKDVMEAALRMHPDRAALHFSAATVATAVGDRDGALESLRETLRLQPTHGEANRQLSKALLARGAVDEAIATARRFAKRAPGREQAWDQLGTACFQKGDYEQAIGAFEAALNLDPDDPGRLCNLGAAMLRTGRFEKALEAMRRGHDLGSKRKGWSYPSEKWVQQCERAIALERRRGEIQSGARPTIDDHLRIARYVCRPKRLFAEALDHFGAAFSMDGALRSQLEPDHVLEAAAAGIHAATGRAADAPADETGRAALRNRVLRLLAAEVAESEDLVRDAQSPSDAAPTRDRVAHWLAEPELEPVGPRSDFAGIPPTEAAEWRDLWKRCEALAPASRPASRPLVSR
jgi:tetratricopeptide (TPR) repeat protein